MKYNITKKIEIAIRLLLVFAVVFTNFGFITNTFADAYENGQVIDPIQSAGTITTSGDVKLEKTVVATEEEGIYEIKLTVTGKDKITTESKTAKIYTAVVVDTSGSMEECFLFWCDDEKFENATTGANAFANELLKNYPSSELALITFASNANVARDFKGENFDSVSYPSPNGGTNLRAAIDAATAELNKKKSSDSKLYMVILSDGYPEYSYGQDTDHMSAAKRAKDAGIEIFTIGYDTDSNTKAVLEGVATSPAHFVEADATNVVTNFSNLAGSIENHIHAGTDAVITDVIADGFTYVDGSATPEAIVDGKKISFNIGNITETGTTVSFKVKADADLGTGFNRTNDFAEVVYTDINGIENTKVTITESPKVYWEEIKYPYIVNYYKDEVAENNLLGSENGTDVIGKEITLNDLIKLNEFKPVGYKDGIIVTTNNIITEDATTILTVNVLYTKKDNLSYTVNYYKDSLTGTLLGSFKVDNIVFNSQVTLDMIEVNTYKPIGYNDGVVVTTLPYKVIDGENIINVVYSIKDNLNYVVEYYKDGEKISNDDENKVLNQTFGNKITEDQINKNKYKPLLGYADGKIETSMPYTIVDGKNIIKVSYQKRTDMSYTVKYLEKDTNNELLEQKEVTGKTYLENFVETAKEAPYGYKLVGDVNQNIVIDEDNKIITFYYEKRNDFKYTVKYLEKVTNNVLAEEVVRTERTFNEEYIENALEIDGYVLVDRDDNTNPRKVVINSDDQIIIFYYEKRNDLTYKVNYYQDSLEGTLLGVEVVENQTFKQQITTEDINSNLYKPVGYNDGVIVTSMPYEVTTGENIINVVYNKKTNLTYRVEYYYDDNIDSSKTDYFENMEFGTVIYNYTEKQPYGYEFVSDTAPLTIEDTEDNVIKVYYKSVSQGELTPPNTGIEKTNYLPVIYLISTLGLIALKRKEQN